VVPPISVVSRPGISDSGEGDVRVLETLTLSIQGNSRTPTPFDPFTVFESGEIVIDRVFRISVEMVIPDRNLRVRVINRGALAGALKISLTIVALR
jgi:hypothetical protein